jgi:hypothetical protein
VDPARIYEGSNLVKQLVCSCLSTFAFFVVSAAAADNTGDRSTPAVVFRAMAATADPGSIQLANGITTNRRDWRTLLLTEVGKQILADGSTAPIFCTATLVGPGVILTAAHCLDGGPGRNLATTAELDIGGSTFTAACTVAQAYREAVDRRIWHGSKPRVPQDYALCRFTIPHSAPDDLADLSYEVVDIATSVVAGNPVLLTGFGCSEISIDTTGVVRTSGFDNKFRVGDALTAPASSAARSQDSYFLTVFSDARQPTLCPGDSGGPLLTGASAKSQTSPRRVRGLNSSVGRVNGAADPMIFVSYIAPLATSEFRSFKDEWYKKNTDTFICGIDHAAGTPPCAK